MTETAPVPPVPDDFYRAFEDRFRGSRELILERLEAYMPFVRSVAASGGGRALDLGCGRGEWLQLMTREGLDALGVDLDDGMLSAARDLALNVSKMDALEALRAESDGSLAIVSGFHIAEHLPFGTLLALMVEARRVLRPGGILILETPNPENIVVGTWSFHLDPTHIAPIPPLRMSFMAEYAGFIRSTILRLNGPEPRTDGLLVSVFSDVSVDFGLVAQVDGPEISTTGEMFEAQVGVDLWQSTNNFDTSLQQRIEHREATFHNEIALVRSEVAGLRDALNALESQLRVREERSWIEWLFFSPAGRPVRLLRRLAFHSNGRPRGGFLGRLARTRSGVPRAAFRRWMKSPEYLALPWPKKRRAPEHPAPFESGGPEPESHPRRQEIRDRISELVQNRVYD